MELGFGWLDVVVAVVRLVIAVSLIYFVFMMVRLWSVLKVWSPETLRSLVGRGHDC